LRLDERAGNVLTMVALFAVITGVAYAARGTRDNVSEGPSAG
jgi:hypothetical protein